MVGTYANGWLAQLRNEWCRDRYMKPRSKGNPLALPSPPNYPAISSAKTKTLSKKTGLDASTTSGSHGEERRSVFA